MVVGQSQLRHSILDSGYFIASVLERDDAPCAAPETLVLHHLFITINGDLFYDMDLDNSSIRLLMICI